MIEIYSDWGRFEWLLEDALSRGYKVGFVANSDGHKGRPGASHPGASTFGAYGGLTCVLAEVLTRDAIFEAIRQRRCYETRPEFQDHGEWRSHMIGSAETWTPSSSTDWPGCSGSASTGASTWTTTWYRSPGAPGSSP